jgi:hypothetical protein
VKAHAIAAVVFALAAWCSLRRKRETLVCKDGAKFVPANASSDVYKSGSDALRAQINKYGGYCVRSGSVTFDNGTLDAPEVGSSQSIDEPAGGVPTDPALITHPWQLP